MLISDLDELKKRKEHLLLEQDVARLERKQELGKSGNWTWWWVGPLALVGLGLLVAGTATDHTAVDEKLIISTHLLHFQGVKRV